MPAKSVVEAMMRAAYNWLTDRGPPESNLPYRQLRRSEALRTQLDVLGIPKVADLKSYGQVKTLGRFLKANENL